MPHPKESEQPFVNTPIRTDNRTEATVAITNMSFQDIGKRGAGRPSNRDGAPAVNGFGSSSGRTTGGGDEYASVSQGILQYQVCPAKDQCGWS